MNSDGITEAELMARHRITKVPQFYYHYREWKYSSLSGAVAQARRDEGLSKK